VIAVIGDLLLDVYVLSQLREAEQGQGILLRPGGSAANTAAWLSHLGSPVTFIGCVGADAVGDMLGQELESHGVRTRLTVAHGSETGAVAIELTEGAERVMRSSRGANMALSTDAIRRVEPAKILHLSGYSLLGPYGLAMLEAAGQAARDLSATLSFDPSSVGVIRRFGGPRFLEAIESSGVNLLLPNRDEALALTGGGNVTEAAVMLGSRVEMVIVKDGARGALWSTGERSGLTPTEPAIPRDTTGAGDAFNAGVIRSLELGLSGEVACARGNQVAAQAIGRYGGRPPAPDRRGG
jgi:sugar/nucleoside kinase (ribokinase family)